LGGGSNWYGVPTYDVASFRVELVESELKQDTTCIFAPQTKAKLKTAYAEASMPIKCAWNIIMKLKNGVIKIIN